MLAAVAGNRRAEDHGDLRHLQVIGQICVLVMVADISERNVQMMQRQQNDRSSGRQQILHARRDLGGRQQRAFILVPVRIAKHIQLFPEGRCGMDLRRVAGGIEHLLLDHAAHAVEQPVMQYLRDLRRRIRCLNVGGERIEPLILIAEAVEGIIQAVDEVHHIYRMPRNAAAGFRQKQRRYQADMRRERLALCMGEDQIRDFLPHCGVIALGGGDFRNGIADRINAVKSRDDHILRHAQPVDGKLDRHSNGHCVIRADDRLRKPVPVDQPLGSLPRRVRPEIAVADVIFPQLHAVFRKDAAHDLFPGKGEIIVLHAGNIVEAGDVMMLNEMADDLREACFIVKLDAAAVLQRLRAVDAEHGNIVGMPVLRDFLDIPFIKDLVAENDEGVGMYLVDQVKHRGLSGILRGFPEHVR